MKITAYYEDGTTEWVTYYDMMDALDYARSESSWKDTIKCVMEDGTTFTSGFAR